MKLNSLWIALLLIPKLLPCLLIVNRFFGYKPQNRYNFSIDHLWENKLRIHNRSVQKKFKAPQKAHFFHFGRWDRSLFTKFFIEWMFVILLWYINSVICNAAINNMSSVGQYSDTLTNALSRLVRNFFLDYRTKEIYQILRELT